MNPTEAIEPPRALSIKRRMSIAGRASGLALQRFEEAHSELEATGPVLVVTGLGPGEGAAVELFPRRYITRPRWWDVELRGYPDGPAFGTPSKPFRLVFPLEGATGTVGVRVVG